MKKIILTIIVLIFAQTSFASVFSEEEIEMMQMGINDCDYSRLHPVFIDAYDVAVTYNYDPTYMGELINAFKTAELDSSVTLENIQDAGNCEFRNEHMQTANAIVSNLYLRYKYAGAHLVSK